MITLILKSIPRKVEEIIWEGLIGYIIILCRVSLPPNHNSSINPKQEAQESQAFQMKRCHLQWTANSLHLAIEITIKQPKINPHLTS